MRGMRAAPLGAFEGPMPHSRRGLSLHAGATAVSGLLWCRGTRKLHDDRRPDLLHDLQHFAPVLRLPIVESEAGLIGATAVAREAIGAAQLVPGWQE